MEQFSIDPILLDRFQRLGVALAVGLLVGIERGWKDREVQAGERTAGIRTFALIGLLGGASAIVAAELGGVVAAAAFLGFALVIGAFELNAARKTNSRDATPVVAALVVFTLGAVAGVGFLRAAAAAAVATALLLALKAGIHRWLEKITFEELRTGLLLGAMTVILLPLLPAEPIDPWGAISLRAVWLMTIFISVVSFSGYAAIRIAGPGRGPLFAGLAGGLVSSTATAVSFSRMAKRAGANEGALVAGMVAANGMMFARLGVVVAALRPQLVMPLAFALAPAVAVSAALAFALHRRAAKDAKGSGDELVLKNPLDLMLALQFGVLLAVISIAAAWLEQLFGASGVYALAAASGLADVDAIALSMARGGAPGVEVAAGAILIAATANTISKAALSWGAGGARVGRSFAAASLAALIAGGAGYAAYVAVG